MKNLVSGLAGAIVLNVLHETYRRIDAKAPRVHLLGEEALSKGMRKAGMQPPAGNRLYATTLVADLLSNTLYYALIGGGKKKNTWLRAVVLGSSAGIGAVLLPKRMGLNDAPVTRSTRTKALTVAWYLVGALAAGAVLEAYNRKKK